MSLDLQKCAQLFMDLRVGQAQREAYGGAPARDVDALAMLLKNVWNAALDKALSVAGEDCFKAQDILEAIERLKAEE